MTWCTTYQIFKQQESREKDEEIQYLLRNISASVEPIVLNGGIKHQSPAPRPESKPKRTFVISENIPSLSKELIFPPRGPACPLLRPRLSRRFIWPLRVYVCGSVSVSRTPRWRGGGPGDDKFIAWPSETGKNKKLCPPFFKET